MYDAASSSSPSRTGSRTGSRTPAFQLPISPTSTFSSSSSSLSSRAAAAAEPWAGDTPLQAYLRDKSGSGSGFPQALPPRREHLLDKYSRHQVLAFLGYVPPGETMLTQQQLAAQFIMNNSAPAGVTEAAVLNDIQKLNRSYQWFSASLCVNNQFLGHTVRRVSGKRCGSVLRSTTQQKS